MFIDFYGGNNKPLWSVMVGFYIEGEIPLKG